MFSLSKFQLPYYILIIFPHFSIITANWLAERDALKKNKAINIIFIVLFFVLIALALTVLILLDAKNLIVFIILLFLTAVFFFMRRKDFFINAAVKSICFAFLLSSFLNIGLYPTIMNYEAGIHAGKWYNANQPASQTVTMYRCIPQTSFTFYCNAPVKYADTITQANLNASQPLILYGSKNEIDSLLAKGFKIAVLQGFDYFHISELKGKFINSATRQHELQTFELVKVY